MTRSESLAIVDDYAIVHSGKITTTLSKTEIDVLISVIERGTKKAREADNNAYALYLSDLRDKLKRAREEE